MTDQDIRDAIAGMSPDNAAKERMLHKILSDPRRRRKHRVRRLLLAAAAAACLTAAAAAQGTDFFGLWAVGLRNREIIVPEEVRPNIFVPTVDVVDMVSMQGLAGSPEYQASMAWESFLAEYDPDGAILAENDQTYLGEQYDAYLCYTREMADQLDALCEEYGLELLGPSETAATEAELFGSVGIGNVCAGGSGGNQMIWGYYYAGGTFLFEGTVQQQGRPTTDYQFRCAAKGYLGTGLLNVGDLDHYEQWEYVTENGVPLLLALGPSKGLVIADTEKSFVMVNVLGNWSDFSFHLDRDALEDFAEAFDFSVIP